MNTGFVNNEHILEVYIHLVFLRPSFYQVVSRERIERNSPCRGERKKERKKGGDREIQETSRGEGKRKARGREIGESLQPFQVRSVSSAFPSPLCPLSQFPSCTFR